MHKGPMSGSGVIVMGVSAAGYSDNGHRYYEHSSLQAAKAEAHRLARETGGKFVVYVPMAIVEPAPQTVERPIPDLLAPVNESNGEPY